VNIHTIVIHYSATYPDAHVDRAVIDKWHKERGFREIGYHWVITRDGKVQEGRPEGTLGAHVRGHNSGTIGICWAGGLDRASGPNVGVWNPTPAQEAAMVQLIRDIQKRWPDAKRVIGHKDLVPTECPGLPKGGVAEWWAKQGGKERKLSDTRTVRGGMAAGVGTLGATVAEQAEQIAPLAGMSDMLKYAFVALTIAGIGLTLYARKDDWDEGKR
jgi:N-acetylmuramoyl-L-alanine amidase